MATEMLCAGLELLRQDTVLTVTLDRPDGNLISREMCHALINLLSNPPGGAHILVLTGAGDSFCLGRERKAASPQELSVEVADLISLNQSLTQSSLVTIARVNGSAAGFGVGLAALCDVAVAVSNARFSFPEVKMGLAPTIVLAWLQQAVGRRLAFELTATGKDVCGDQLKTLGLANTVVEQVEALDAAVAEWIDRLSGGSARVHSEIKSMLRDSESMTANQAYALSAGRLVLGSMMRGQ